MRHVLATMILLLATLTEGSVLAQGLLPESDRAHYRALLDERRRDYPALEAAVFSLLAEAGTAEEADALLFLLATSPLSDLADRGGAFFLSVARMSLDTRRDYAWGSRIPDPIFLQFVLPPRSGNEAIDSSRLVFPAQLRSRIANLGMREAVLEINHWCHERVTYAPSDARTRAPLATIRNARGRCGEESVFTTTALRAAGIPARQIYVPRWAHADDNHAWVEAWVDGGWHFLGACEPDVDLDHAWFTEPARRAMLTAATAQGRFDGTDDILSSSRFTTRLNTLPVYAPTRVITVQVRDGRGMPVAKARVDFSVFNYAEFFPIARITTDGSGVASLRTGFGDLLVWAHDGARRAFAPFDRNRRDTLQLQLSERVASEGRIELDMRPPPEAKVSQAEHPGAAATAMRIRGGDSLRGIYEATFVDSTRAVTFAERFGYAPDSCWMLLSQARGNGEELLRFLADASRINTALALRVLRTLSEKDLQDAPSAVLRDHYRDAMAQLRAGGPCDDVYVDHVLAPRIGREELRPWRGVIRDALATHPQLGALGDDDTRARRYAAWIRDSIRIDTESNWGGVPIPVPAVYRLRAGDPYSRALLFVAMCRASGIPARLHSVTGEAEYRAADSWMAAGLDAGTAAVRGQCRLVLRPRAGQHVQSPVYGQHFTLARFDGGIYHTLDFENSPDFESWPAEVQVPAGDYMIVTGNRLPDGSVLAAMEFLSLPDGSIRECDLIIRDDDSRPPVLGRIDAALLPAGPAPLRILLWIERDTEPVSHALRDLAAERQTLGEHAVAMYLAGSGLTSDELHATARRALPAETQILPAGAEALRTAVLDALHLPERIELPLIIVCEANGTIVFASRGYSIGVGAQILRMLERLRARDADAAHD